MLPVPYALARDMTTVMSFLELLKTYDDLLKASSAVNSADFIPCFWYLPLQIRNAPWEFYHALNQAFILYYLLLLRFITILSIYSLSGMFIALHVKDHLTTYDKVRV